MAAMDPAQWTLNSFLLFLLFQFCTSIDTITRTQPITDGDILISTGENFALGFFSPGSSTNRYLAIWYNKISDKNPVWVANRETPLNNTNGVLTINGDGNLVILDSNQNTTAWSTNVSLPHNDSIAKLLDSGNLVLTQNHSNRVLWQSFDYPTHTILPGMKLGLNKTTGQNWSLISWKSRNDPARGNYSWGFDPRGSPQLFLYKESTPYWRSGPWIGNLGFNGVPEMANPRIFNVSFVNDEEEVYVRYNLFNESTFSRYVLDDTGSLHPATWLEGIRRWHSLGSTPMDRCDNYGLCGPYGRCNADDALECECLPGYEPASPRDWYLRDWSSGCTRKRVQECGIGEGFLTVARVKVPDTTHSKVDTNLSLKECENQCLSNCSCTAYTNADINGGGAFGCIAWHGELMDIREFTDGGQDLYVRVDSIELAANARRKSQGFLDKKGNVAILAVSIGVGSILLVFCGYCFLKKMSKTKGVRTENERRREHFLSNLTTSATSFEGSPGAKKFEESRANPELPFFDLSTIVTATDNFSLANKLGQGGFGPVYKGRLCNGQEIAVKRLSKTSGQGMEEFKNEVMLIAKLQHRNLVKLRGCCIQEEEKMLIYEYMPNKSLDSFIFDQIRKALLDWTKRFEIIVGIARGVLYLHQDSRLRIIHRDLKASNVLLDAEMNPKISDFGMARIFGGNQTQANTNRVVGTYGYMSPEYAMDGLFSIKSDVFSFGVILLEIISGKRNNGFYHEDRFLNLIKHTWDFWSEDRALDLVDSSMAGSYSAHEVLRCIHVGLLCVQESARDRPPMSTVIFMLGNETTLPPPKQPAFMLGGNHNGPLSSSSGTGPCSINEVTITMMEAR